MHTYLQHSLSVSCLVLSLTKKRFKASRRRAWDTYERRDC